MAGESSEENSNDIFYGSGANTSDVSPEDLALLNKANGVEVRDGDEFVDLDTGNEEDTPEGDPEGEPEDKEEEGDKKPVTVEEKINTANKELEEVGKDLESKGVDITKIVESYQTNGKFSEEDYSALEKAGYPKVVVDAIARGQEAIAQEASRALYESVGGPEEFAKLSQFATESDAAAVEAFNEAYQRGDMKTAKVVLQAIDRAYKAQYGTANKMISGQPGASKAAQSEGFANRAEMVKAMSDRRYGIDLKYTAEVEQKVARAAF